MAQLTSPVAELLNDLRAAFASRGLNVDRYLRPGLAPGEIAALAARLPFTLPEEIVALYTWRNGQPPDADWEPDSFRFRDNVFVSLERALHEYDEIQRHYGAGSTPDADGFDLRLSFPFAAFEGAWYVLVCGEHRLNSPHPRPVVSIFEGIELYFHSFEAMLRTCADWVRHPRWTAEAGLGLAPEVENELWQRHNPGVFR